MSVSKTRSVPPHIQVDGRLMRRALAIANQQISVCDDILSHVNTYIRGNDDRAISEFDARRLTKTKDRAIAELAANLNDLGLRGLSEQLESVYEKVVDPVWDFAFALLAWKFPKSDKFKYPGDGRPESKAKHHSLQRERLKDVRYRVAAVSDCLNEIRQVLSDEQDRIADIATKSGKGGRRADDPDGDADWQRRWDSFKSECKGRARIEVFAADNETDPVSVREALDRHRQRNRSRR